MQTTVIRGLAARVTSVLLALTFISLFTRASFAEEQCGSDPQVGFSCHAWVTRAHTPISFYKQETPVTCWAASVVNILRLYGVPVGNEESIVAQTTGFPRLAQPSDMNGALNHTYLNSAGQPVITISILKSTDNYTGSSHGLTNTDIYQSLSRETPVYYADIDHAMVLTDVWVTRTPMGPVIFRAAAIDPAIGRLRYLTISPTLNELQGMYAAVINVARGGGDTSTPIAGGYETTPDHEACITERIERCMRSCTGQYGYAANTCRQVLCRPDVGANVKWEGDCPDN
ncbi:hypothetical protein [Burkholderia gladioli]|uniref:hypothetical protein n=1 Tax=Burkholderia gladioli TaxID=28095 RepID=UPI001C6004C0|nr:hypothetical protein [Burkholderia gladioli]MBW5287910.1 hypothetical protein [Burkholderia gladioli]